MKFVGQVPPALLLPSKAKMFSKVAPAGLWYKTMPSNFSEKNNAINNKLLKNKQLQ